MCCNKICFLEQEPVGAVLIMGGAGAEICYLEHEPRKNGSAPQHCPKHCLTFG